MYYSSSVITSTRRCTTRSVSPWSVSIWTVDKTWSICFVSARLPALSGSRTSLKKWSLALYQRLVTFSQWVSAIVILSRLICSCSRTPSKWKSLTLVSRRTTIKRQTMVELVQWLRSEEHLSIWVHLYGSLTLKMVETHATPLTTFTNLMSFHAVWSSTSALPWRT